MHLSSRLFSSCSLCLALPFQIHFNLIPSWKHSTTPSSPALLGFRLLCLIRSWTWFCSMCLVSYCCNSFILLICFLLSSELLKGRSWALTLIYLKFLSGIYYVPGSGLDSWNSKVKDKHISVLMESTVSWGWTDIEETITAGNCNDSFFFFWTYEGKIQGLTRALCVSVLRSVAKNWH